MKTNLNGEIFLKAENVRAMFALTDKNVLAFITCLLAGKEWAKKAGNEVSDKPWANIDWNLVDWTDPKWENVKW